MSYTNICSGFQVHILRPKAGRTLVPLQVPSQVYFGPKVWFMGEGDTTLEFWSRCLVWVTAYFGIKLGIQGDSKRYTFVEMEIGVSGYFGMKCGLQGGGQIGTFWSRSFDIGGTAYFGIKLGSWAMGGVEIVYNGPATENAWVSRSLHILVQKKTDSAPPYPEWVIWISLRVFFSFNY